MKPLPLLLAFTILAVSRIHANPASKPEAIEAAVVVVGATPAGIAAAVSAARSGANVVERLAIFSHRKNGKKMDSERNFEKLGLRSRDLAQVDNLMSSFNPPARN